MPTLSTSAGTVAYDSRGSGDPVVLLPSGGHDQHDYDDIRELLPGGLRSIGVDWPGHGRSPAGPAPATESRLAQIIEELLESLAPGGAVLAGNSVGGNVAARLAVRRPDLVKGLMIIDGGDFEESRLATRVFCALMSRAWLACGVYPLFSWAYMRSRTAADRRARANAIAITRTAPGVRRSPRSGAASSFPSTTCGPRPGESPSPPFWSGGATTPFCGCASARQPGT
jgi:pimeloyl-ACP methyl ester carboxylesterase